MKAIYAGIAVLLLLAPLTGEVAENQSITSPIAATSAEFTAPAATVTEVEIETPPVERDALSAPRLDMNGNEVEDALADYRLDIAGGLYERHSPETALPRLGSPSS